jgi:hypothetical protein
MLHRRTRAGLDKGRRLALFLRFTSFQERHGRAVYFRWRLFHFLEPRKRVMTESISSWMVRAAGIVFVVAFLGSIWQESLKRTPTRDDLNDARFEIATSVSTLRGSLVGSKLVATNTPHRRFSFRKGLARAIQSARQSRLTMNSSSPH